MYGLFVAFSSGMRLVGDGSLRVSIDGETATLAHPATATH